MSKQHMAYSCCSFPRHPCITQWAQGQHGPGGRDGGDAWASTHQANLAGATAEGPICQQQGPPLSSQHGVIPQGDRPATWWQVDCTGSHPPWKGQCCPHWNTLHMDLPSLTPCFCQNYHPWAPRMPCLPRVLPALLLVKELTSQPKSMAVSPRSWNRWSYCVPTILKQLP